VCLDDLLADAQPEPGAPAHLFRAHERLEQPLPDGRLIARLFGIGTAGKSLEQITQELEDTAARHGAPVVSPGSSG